MNTFTSKSEKVTVFFPSNRLDFSNISSMKGNPFSQSGCRLWKSPHTAAGIATSLSSYLVSQNPGLLDKGNKNDKKVMTLKAMSGGKNKDRSMELKALGEWSMVRILRCLFHVVKTEVFCL